jgi:hypothetical protein
VRGHEYITANFYISGAHNGSVVTECDNGSYCCGQRNASCCDAGYGLFIVKNQLTAGLPTPTTSTISVTSLSTRFSSSGSRLTSHPTQDSSLSIKPATSPRPVAIAESAVTATVAAMVHPSAPLSTGAKIGLGIGVPVLVLAIFGAGFYFARRYWQRKLRQYKSNDQRGGDTATILPDVSTSRPNTGHTVAASMSASIKTTDDFRALEGEVPEIPTYFTSDAVISSAVLQSDLHSDTWPYHGGKEDAFQMQTYAMATGDSIPDQTISPIKGYVAEMDAYEPRANNEGVFELGLPSPRLPVEMGGQDDMTSSQPEIDPITEVSKPAAEKTKGDLTTLPGQRRGISWLKAPIVSGEGIGLDLLKVDSKEQNSISTEKESLRGEAEEKIFHSNDPSEEKEWNLDFRTAEAFVAETANVPLETGRGRPPIRKIFTGSPSSIPVSQFSPSSSPSRLLSIINEDMLSSTGRAFKRARSEARKGTSSKVDAEGAVRGISRPTSSGKAHISSMAVDTGVNMRPRNKSMSSMK